MNQRQLNKDETFCYHCSDVCRKPSIDTNGYMVTIPLCQACALTCARPRDEKPVTTTGGILVLR